MDMMARGKVIISTAVDGIPDYVTHKKTGLLIDAVTETEVVQTAIALIELILHEPALRTEIEANTYQFAQKHFSESNFNNKYRSFLSA
jgi:glycosyltransferase involved in cell wall biosynthesis